MGFIINPYAFGAAYDADAQAFFTAAGITDNTQKTAVNQLVVDLKTYGIWTKMKAIYPFVGGTATTHKYNLKNPLDTDAAFRLVFNGGWTHSSTGVLPNGTNGYADTKLVLNTLLRDNNSTGIYSRTNSGAQVADYGVYDTGVQGSVQLAIRGTDDNLYVRNGSNNLDFFANTNSSGFFQNTRRDSSNIIISRNTTKTTISRAATDNSAYFSNVQTFPIAALNLAGTILSYSNREYAFMYIGNSSLNNTELDNYYTAVQAFQTTLSRNV